MFRKIVSADREKYIEMAREFYASPAVLHSVPVSHFEKTFNEMMKSYAYAVGFIIEEQEKTAGYALLAKTFSQEAGGLTVWIEEIYILPEFRGKGLGSDFLEFVKNEIPAARYRLETEPENERAKALYKRHGFEKLDYEQFIIDRG